MHVRCTTIRKTLHNAHARTTPNARCKHALANGNVFGDGNVRARCVIEPGSYLAVARGRRTALRPPHARAGMSTAILPEPTGCNM
eukprot:2652599-Pyramimonas_sp.AAC.1